MRSNDAQKQLARTSLKEVANSKLKEFYGLSASVPHFSRCAAFFQVCRTLPSVPLFPRVPHFAKCATFCQLCRIFPAVPHFPNCGALFKEWCIFSRVAHFSFEHFSMCGALFQFSLFFKYKASFKCASFFQMCRILPSVPHSSLCAEFCQVCRTLISMMADLGDLCIILYFHIKLRTAGCNLRLNKPSGKVPYKVL